MFRRIPGDPKYTAAERRHGRMKNDVAGAGFVSPQVPYSLLSDESLGIRVKAGLRICAEKMIMSIHTQYEVGLRCVPLDASMLNIYGSTAQRQWLWTK